MFGAWAAGIYINTGGVFWGPGGALAPLGWQEGAGGRSPPAGFGVKPVLVYIKLWLRVCAQFSIVFAHFASCLAHYGIVLARFARAHYGVVWARFLFARSHYGFAGHFAGFITP